MARRRFKRYHPPGTSPGTLPPVEPPPSGAVLSVLVFSEESFEERSVRTVAEADEILARHQDSRAWLRVVGHDPGVLAEVADRHAIHPLVLEDVLNLGQRPKLEDYERYLFAVVDVLRPGALEDLDEQQISLIIFPGLVISVEERETDVFRLVLERLRTGHGKIRRMGVDYLAYALVDAAVDHFFPLLQSIGEKVDEIEDGVLAGDGRVWLDRLHACRRDLVRLRRTAWPLRDMVAALARSDSQLIADSTRVWLRDVHDHAIQIIDMVETYRDMSSSVLDLYLSSVSNRTNEVMKVLTMIATIFIPLTFIVGVYGMNFDTSTSPWNMPELEWALGYPAVWVVMVAIAAAMLVMFRRRGWL